MHRKARFVSAASLGGALSLLFLPMACAGRLGPIQAAQTQDPNRPDVPARPVERLKECMANHAQELEPGEYKFRPTIKVNEDGVVVEVTTTDIPGIAWDFSACTRVALGDMPLPMPWLLRLRDLEKNTNYEQAQTEERKHMGMLATTRNSAPSFVIVLVGIGFAELALQAAGYTFLFAVSVELVHEAAKNGWRAKCSAHYAACIATATAQEPGNHWKQTRCGICQQRCEFDKKWPVFVGNGSCEYWDPTW